MLHLGHPGTVLGYVFLSPILVDSESRKPCLGSGRLCFSLSLPGGFDDQLDRTPPGDVRVVKRYFVIGRFAYPKVKGKVVFVLCEHILLFVLGVLITHKKSILR